MRNGIIRVVLLVVIIHIAGNFHLMEVWWWRLIASAIIGALVAAYSLLVDARIEDRAEAWASNSYEAWIGRRY